MRTLVAILALSTGLLHAQGNSPAQPVSTPVLLAAASSPLTDSSAHPAHTNRISTGVVPARLVHTVTLEESNTYVRHSLMPRTVALHIIVDATGKPQNLQLVRPSDPMTTREVLNAVAQFRYQPATVNGVPTAQPVNLEVSIDTN